MVGNDRFVWNRMLDSENNVIKTILVASLLINIWHGCIVETFEAGISISKT